jgi:hypothetical protein
MGGQESDFWQNAVVPAIRPKMSLPSVIFKSHTFVTRFARNSERPSAARREVCVPEGLPASGDRPEGSEGPVRYSAAS